MESVDLQASIEHKTGCLRDLVVMDAITGNRRLIIPGPHTLDNPECRRLMESHGTQNQ